MSSELKLRRGSTVAHSTFTGADGEVTFDTDKNVIVSHDGVTIGGFPHTKAADLAAPNGAALVTYLPSGTGAIATNVQSKMRESVSVEDFGAVRSAARTTAAPSQAIMEANTAAFNAAILHLLLAGGGDLYVPNGVYHTYGTIDLSLDVYTSAFASYSRPCIRILGSTSSTIYQNHPTAPLITNRYVQLRISGLILAGRGSATTGNLLELYGTQFWTLDDMEFRGTSGRGLFVVGSERGCARNLTFILTRQAIVNGTGANNETYYYNTIIIGPGYSQDMLTGSNTINYSTNPIGGAVGTYTQSKRAAVDISNSVNYRFIGGSIKSTASIAGMRVRSGEQIVVQNIYFEGFGTGNINPSIIFGNNSEATTLSGSINNTVTTIPLTDTKWFLPVVSNLNYGIFTEAMEFVIYDPADLAVYEIVTVKYMFNNSAYEVVRGQAGTTALNWNSGVVFRESLRATSITDLAVYDCHLESYQSLPVGATLDSTVALGNTAGEIIVGNMFDEFHRSSAYITTTNYNLNISNNRTRAFGSLNAGLIQVWGHAVVISTDFSPLGVVSADPVIGSTTFSSYGFTTPHTTYVSHGPNNIPYSLNTGKSRAALGGYGYTYVLDGLQGIALGKTSTITTDLATFDDINGLLGFKYRYYTGGAWTCPVAMTRTGIVLNNLTSILTGAGSPEGVVVAQPGSLYTNSSGGAGVSLYVKETGTGNTGWVAK
jgi:hypothetical protein